MFRKNIHVFCEKPPAVNYKELLKIKPLLKVNLSLNTDLTIDIIHLLLRLKA